MRGHYDSLRFIGDSSGVNGTQLGSMGLSRDQWRSTEDHWGPVGVIGAQWFLLTGFYMRATLAFNGLSFNFKTNYHLTLRHTDGLFFYFPHKLWKNHF